MTGEGNYIKKRLGFWAFVIGALGVGGRLAGLKPAQLPPTIHVTAKRGFLGRWHLVTTANRLEYHASAWTLNGAKRKLHRKVWPR